MIQAKSPFSPLIYLSLFLIFAIGGFFRQAYTVGAGLLLFITLYGMIRYRAEIDFKTEKSLVYIFLTYVVINVCINMIGGHSGRDYELVVRVLLTIPILYLFLFVGLRLQWLMLIFGMSGVLIGIDALYEHFVLGLDRVGFFPVRHGYVAAWFAVISLVSFVFLPRDISYRGMMRVLLCLGVVGGLIASVLTDTRGSWLFFIVACCLLVVYSCFYIQGKSKTLLLSILGACFITMVVIGVTDNAVSQRVEHAVAEVQKYKPNDSSAGTSLGMRLELFRLSAEIIYEHPILGIGTDDFRGKIVQFVQEGKALPYMMALKHTHNDFVDKAVKTGLISAVAMMLCLYLYPFIFFLKRIRHPHQEVRYYALVGSLLVIAWLEFGMTNIFLTTNQGAIYYLVSLAIFWSGIRRLEKDGHDRGSLLVLPLVK